MSSFFVSLGLFWAGAKFDRVAVLYPSLDEIFGYPADRRKQCYTDYAVDRRSEMMDILEAQMIAKTFAKSLLEMNLQRTEMLIAAMDKIRAYNSIYQMNQTNLQDYHMVKAIQDEELARIRRSCEEHAIISLVTAFETYYKELVQQLLADYPDYFTRRSTKYLGKVMELIEDYQVLDYEDIERKLHLNNRFAYYDFFKAYSIPFLPSGEEEFIEYLYLLRNNYVHNAGRPDTKLKTKLAETPSPFGEPEISAEAKRLRTKLRKILNKSYDQVMNLMNI